MTTITGTINYQTIFENEPYQIISGELNSSIICPENIVIQPILDQDKFIITGARDAHIFQQILIESPVSKNEVKLSSPNGTIIMRSIANKPYQYSNITPHGEINQFSTIKFPVEDSILLLGNESLSDFKECHCLSTKKEFLTIDLQRLIKYNNNTTKTKVTLVISNELLATINELKLDIDLNDCFKSIISFPANKVLYCLVEMMNGKIIKPIIEKCELTINIGKKNTILTSFFENPNISTQIGTNGRLRIIFNQNFKSTFIIIVNTVEPVIFNCDNIDNTITFNKLLDNIENKGLISSDFVKLIELSKDNSILSFNNSIDKDILNKIILDYLIDNTTLESLLHLIKYDGTDVFNTNIKHLIDNIFDSTIIMLNQMLEKCIIKRKKLNNSDIQSPQPSRYIHAPNKPPVMDRFSSIPYNIESFVYGC